jgi:hypothetical protein
MNLRRSDPAEEHGGFHPKSEDPTPAASSRCHARSGADAWDRELASRLNEHLAETDSPPDYMRDLRRALAEASWWTLGTAAALAAAFHGLV